MTFNSLVGHFERKVEQLLKEHAESQALSGTLKQKLSVSFVDRLVGVDVFKVLLGLPGSTKGEQRKRAEKARDLVLAALKIS